MEQEHIPPDIAAAPANEEYLEHLSRQYKHIRLERVGLSIQASQATSFHSGWLDGEYYFLARQWTRGKKAYCMPASAGFKLANGDIRSPDVSIILPENPGFPERRSRKFPRLTPDFVIEVHSPGDLLKDSREKMEMWIANGCRLGFLIDPSGQRAFVYRPGIDPIEHQYTDMLDGGDVLPGFSLCPAEVDSDRE